MGEQENIDLQKLSQRELLVITYKEVEKLGSSVRDLHIEQAKHEVRISLMEQKVMIWGALFGGAAGLITAIISALIG
jgi:hypothetical protein